MCCVLRRYPSVFVIFVVYVNVSIKLKEWINVKVPVYNFALSEYHYEVVNLNLI